MNSYLNIRINGKNLEKKEDIENAILKFDEDLKENPDDEATIVGKSVLLYKIGKLNESLECLNQIKNIRNASIIELKAVILMGMSNYKRALDLLNEVLKDPMFRDKYNISDEDLVNVSFDTTSNHRIIEVVKSIISLKSENHTDAQVYKQIKAINFGIKE